MANEEKSAAPRKKVPTAVKRQKKAKAANLVNNSNKSRLNTARRKFLAIIAEGDKAKAKAAFNEFSSILDKSAKKGAITKNSADRRKSRAAAKVAAIA